ncbi:hypothetical protein [Spirochaeta africana]|uniref:Uncharacterized protein n=1 Tax=Spirochaeta africana (strain ATCC 700263 / DSM 8902 / Z-7692) TaxID=889378 RepID=H9UMI1_SPIAZ|nr:hypothetical protein [Spirochaeta africana]AFG38724.1 hypothetical protein Spiaf_2699 [Spirochaeta africana DSM 8902]
MEWISCNRLRTGAAILILAVLSVPAFASEFGFLPASIQAQIEEAETARRAWEQRSREVAAEISIQPYEHQDEFAERLQRAIDRGAGRERRYLEFQLSELAMPEHQVAADDISVTARRTPSRERPVLLEISTDLGMLPEQDSFEVMYPAPRAAGAQTALDRGVQRNNLQAVITYSLSGTLYGEYSLVLTGVQLTNPDDPQISLPRLPMNRRYVFAEGQPITLGTPGGSYHFESGQLPTSFALEGDADWFVSDRYAYTGAYSLQSGPISHSSESVLLYTDMVPAGARISGIQFALRTSTERRYDTLDFFINGRHMDSWSGETDWTEVQFETDLQSGEMFELMWVYDKDGSVSDGDDAVWIDSIELIFEGE